MHACASGSVRGGVNRMDKQTKIILDLEGVEVREKRMLVQKFMLILVLRLE